VGLSIPSQLNVSGSFTNTDGGQFSVYHGAYAGVGSMDNQAASTTTIDSGGELYVNGAFKNEGTVNVNATGEGGYVNAGAIINSGGFTLAGTNGNTGNGYAETDASVFVNKSTGILTINGGSNGGEGGFMYLTGALINKTSGAVTIAGGSTGGSGGLVEAAFVMNAGQLTVNAPNDSSSGSAQLVVYGNMINSGSGTLTLGGSGSLPGGEVIVFGNLKNYGTINDNSAGYIDPNLGPTGGLQVYQQLTNTHSGTVNVGAGAGVNNGGELYTSDFRNYGTVIIGGTDGSALAGDLNVLGSFQEEDGIYTQGGAHSSTTVNGTLEAAGMVIWNGLLQVNGIVTMQSFSFDQDTNADIITPGGTVYVTGSGPTSGGTLGGGGTINGDVDIETYGTLAPGDPADLTINGDLTMDGMEDEEIDGLGSIPGDFDVVTVNGGIDYNGYLDVLVLDDFVPASGEQWIILTWTGADTNEDLVITDASLGGGLYWGLVWQNDTNSSLGGELILEVEGTPTSTPEPGTLLFLGTGIASLLAARRKRLATKA
jgi:autotransporter family porin